MIYINLLLVGIGIFLLAIGLIYIRKIIKTSSNGYVKDWWLIGCLDVFFIIGYGIYTGYLIKSGLEATFIATVVSLVFCAGALFVFLVTSLSAKTISILHQTAALKIEAEHDVLTSIYNRNYFQKEIGKIIDQVKRGGPESIFIFFDLNNFKCINEIYGRIGGDQLLINIAKILQNNLRNADLAIRYDGDEFVVILYNTSLAEAEQKATVMYTQIIEQVKAKYPQCSSFSCAVGMTIINKDVRDVSHLLSTVDKACYQSKISHNIVCKVCELP